MLPKHINNTIKNAYKVIETYYIFINIYLNVHVINWSMVWYGIVCPAVACWASDHWVASSNPLRGKFRH